MARGWGAAGGARRAVPGPTVRARGVLAGRGADQHRRHPDHRQPGRRARTLSIHTIFTTRRESFYWLAILFTFALGTAAGDLVAETFNVGYLTSGLLFAGLIGLVAAAYYVLGLREVAAFWMAYILTRPLGASIGDFLSQDKSDGGLGLGTTATTFIFLATILAVVSYLARTKRDQTLTATGIATSDPALVE